MPVIVGVFLLSSVFHMAFGRWVSALFHACTACLFIARGGIDRWPKPARHLFIAFYAALAVATLFEMLYRAKVIG